ncbi:hypothetical protein [Niastella populi]|uniref:Uncharacterized protein n=1 Tax=Niastella populi TaxID=550983 RepID=A0A1V9GAB9_9BACT|nr:hypothetical protein [Niastella populi]OQP67609.1 hypothetical protein A4R26_12415 [Niastella populi]
MLVVSDIEDAFPAFCKILIRKKVISRHFRWIYNDGHLVILGNNRREGLPKPEFLWFIYSLEEQARQNGGHVHFVLGKQELYCMGQSWNDHPKYAIKPDHSRSPSTAIFNGNIELLNWLRSKNVAEKIGSFLFVHKSVLPFIQHSPCSLIEINQSIRSTLKNNVGSAASIIPMELRTDIMITFGINVLLGHFNVTHIITGNNIICSAGLIDTSLKHASGERRGYLIGKKGIDMISSEGKEKLLLSDIALTPQSGISSGT